MRKRLFSPAMFLALVTLVPSLTPSAEAKVGTRQLKNGAVTTEKIGDGAVTTPKLGDQSVTEGNLAAGSVTGAKLAEGAVTEAKLADGAVATAKLAATERSEGFVANLAGQIGMGGAAETTIASLSLPAGGKYVATAVAALGNSGAVPNLVECELRDDGTVVAIGFANLAELAVFSQTIALTGTSDGGTLTLVCTPDAGAQAKSRVVTAVRVGTLQTQ